MDIKDLKVVGFKKLGVEGCQYASYTIKVRYIDPNGDEPDTVHRRYNDFKWLYASLREEYPAYIIPPIPRSEKYNVFQARLADDFIEYRLKKFNTFLKKLLSVVPLSKSISLKTFVLCPDPPHIGAQIVTDKGGFFVSFATGLASKLYHGKIKIPASIVEVKTKVEEKLAFFQKIQKNHEDVEKSLENASKSCIVSAFSCIDLASNILNSDLPKPKFNHDSKFYDLVDSYSDACSTLKSELKSVDYVKEIAITCSDLFTYKDKISAERQDAILNKSSSGFFAKFASSISPNVDTSTTTPPLSQKVKIIDAEVKLAEINDSLRRGLVEFENTLEIVPLEDKRVNDSINADLFSSISEMCSKRIELHMSLLEYWTDFANALSTSG